jgi:hypothetical protein
MKHGQEGGEPHASGDEEDGRVGGMVVEKKIAAWRRNFDLISDAYLGVQIA